MQRNGKFVAKEGTYKLSKLINPMCSKKGTQNTQIRKRDSEHYEKIRKYES